MSRCCTTDRNAVLSINKSHMPDEPTNRELTEEELKLVVGGQSPKAYERFRCNIINALNYEKLKEHERHHGD